MQVIWNSKLKFVSGSQLFRIALCSLFGSVSGPFTASGFIVLNLNPLIECLQLQIYRITCLAISSHSRNSAFEGLVLNILITDLFAYLFTAAFVSRGIMFVLFSAVSLAQNQGLTYKNQKKKFLSI